MVSVRMSTSLEDIVTYSPYDSQVNKLSYRNTQKIQVSSSLMNLFDLNGMRSSVPNYATPFIFKVIQLLFNGSLKVNYITQRSNVFPRTDLIGLARVRTKPRYEEEEGYFRNEIDPSTYPDGIDQFDPPYISETTHPWTNNSYNNNSSRTRMFWRDSQEDRLRTRGYDTFYGTGSFNCYNYANMIQPAITTDTLLYNFNSYNSIYSMDSYTDVTLEADNNNYSGKVYITCSQEVYGDLAPYSHLQQFLTTITSSDETNNNLVTNGKQVFIRMNPKPQFIHNLYIPEGNYLNGFSGEYFIYNTSYQNGLDCNIRPFYDTYEEFRANIKHLSQQKSIIPEFIVSNYPGIIDNEEVGATNYFMGNEGPVSRD